MTTRNIFTGLEPQLLETRTLMPVWITRFTIMKFCHKSGNIFIQQIVQAWTIWQTLIIINAYTLKHSHKQAPSKLPLYTHSGTGEVKMLILSCYICNFGTRKYILHNYWTKYGWCLTMCWKVTITEWCHGI